jgi:hypothetical protein
LRNRPSDNTDLRRYIDNMMQADARAKSLVERILAFSRSGSSERTSIDVQAVIEETLELLGAASLARASTPVRMPHGRGQTVLIIDNEKPQIALAEEILAELGYEPVGFSSSAAALRAFRESPQRFDIVLTDEAMSELTGTALTRNCAAASRGADRADGRLLGASRWLAVHGKRVHDLRHPGSPLGKRHGGAALEARSHEAIQIHHVIDRLNVD